MICCELHKIIKTSDWYRMDTWSFTEALGDTIMEKYEGLYVKLIEVSKKVGGLTHVICGQDLGSIFSTATCGFEPEPWPENVELFKLDFYRLGRINNRFDIFVDNALTGTAFVCGPNGIQRLKIKDFLI